MRQLRNKRLRSSKWLNRRRRPSSLSQKLKLSKRLKLSSRLRLNRRLKLSRRLRSRRQLPSKKLQPKKLQLMLRILTWLRLSQIQSAHPLAALNIFTST